MMPQKFLVVHPGAQFSTHDVHVALVEGLRARGCAVAEFRLDGRIERQHQFLHFLWRREKKARPDTHWPKPTAADVLYQASAGLVERALQRNCTDVIVVSAMFLQPERIALCRRAGLRVWLLCTESPYDLEQEMRIAGLCNGCWTNERTSVPALQAMTPTAYLPHGWRPGVHDQVSTSTPDIDVLFVGSLFDERRRWMESVDWTGIDLAIYGTTELLGSRSSLQAHVRGNMVSNVNVVGLMQRSRIVLNLFRGSPGVIAESLNPRCYEATAAGACLVSDARPELTEVFGDSVPIITPETTSSVLRDLLADDARRLRLASSAQKAVAAASWPVRVDQMLENINQWQQVMLSRSA